MQDVKRKTAAFLSLGCKVNSYDTEAIEEQFERAGYERVDFQDRADVYLVNTCTVTHLGDKKSRQMLRRAKRINPDAIVIAAGCYAQTAPDELSALPEVDLIIGTKERGRIVELVDALKEREAPSSVYIEDLRGAPFEELEISKTHGHTRAYIKIQEGCRQYCSYCIVPYARGPVRSRPIPHALAEIKRMAEAGFKEIVLTGIHVASYGTDFPDDKPAAPFNEALITLLEEASQIEGIERIRLSSLEPRLMTEAFLEKLSRIPEVCDHFHLSLQAGSNATLARMRRKYTKEEYRDIVSRIRSFYPKAGMTTDIIVGFPGETEEDFLESLAFMNEIGFSRVHIFPYSPRKGTPAASMDAQVPSEMKKERVRRLEEAEEKLERDALLDASGSIREVLLEKRNPDGYYTGYTENYLPVRFYTQDQALTGSIQTLRLTQTDELYLLGERIEKREESTNE